MNPDLAVQNRRERTFLILATALCVWFGFPNDFVSLPLLVLLWPCALCFIGFGARDRKSAFCYCWLAAFLGFVPALYWLCYPVRDVGGLPWPLAFVCAAFIAACLSVQGGLYGLVARYCGNFNRLSSVLLLALSWYALEYCFAICVGFPWLAISGALAQWPFSLQTAEFFGAYLVSSIWLLTIYLILSAFLLSSNRPKGFYSRRALCGYLILGFLIFYGFYGLGKASSGPTIDVLYIEGNIDQNQKWLPAFQEGSLNRYISLTRRGLEEAREKDAKNPLIVWPETALPFFFERHFAYAERVAQSAREWGCPLLFGAPELADKKGLPEEAVYNRAFLMSPSGRIEGFYDKVHLVPFGEYLPEWLKFKFLDALLQGVGVYQAGDSGEPLKYGSLALGMLICYEGVFPWLARERVAKGANALVDISNDGWFRRSPAARQHLFLTVPRCVEQNRWLFRATNTGVSATINSRGQIIDQGPQFSAGWVLSRGKLLEKRTLFYYIEPWIPALVGVLIIAIIFCREARHKEEQ